MAQTSWEITMNFRSAIRQADRLESVAEQMNSMAQQRFSASIQELSVGWKGENANAYLRKCESLKQKIGETAKQLRGVAADIRSIAQRTYDAEMAALRIAQERNY